MASLFHSDLKKWVKQAPVEARVESDIIDGTHGPYVKLRIDGQVQNYNCDSAQVEEQLTGLQGRMIEIVRADGNRESATLEVDVIQDQDPAPHRQAPPARRQAPVRQGPQRPQQQRPARQEAQRPARREREPEPEREPLSPEELAEQKARVELKTSRAAYAYMQQLCTNMVPAMRLVHERLVPVLKELGYTPSCEDVRALAHGLAIDTRGHFDMHNMPKVHPLEAEKEQAAHQHAPARRIPVRTPAREPDPEPTPEIEEEVVPF